MGQWGNGAMGQWGNGAMTLAHCLIASLPHLIASEVLEQPAQGVDDDGAEGLHGGRHVTLRKF